MAASPNAGVPVHEALLEVVQAVRSELPAEIRLRRSIEARGLESSLDDAVLQELIQTLLSSAAGELIPGGGILELGLFEVDVDDANFASRRGIQPGLFARVSVRAMAADPEHDPRLFIDSTASDLGDPALAELETRLDTSGARLTVHVVDGRLQLFSVYIPATRIAPYDDEGLARGCGTVLFVDDDEALVDIHRRSMEGLGYEVIECTEATEALELVTRFPAAFELVLSDLSMPDIRGDELARRIRSVAPKLPICLSTGLAVAGSGDSPPADDFELLLAKPFSLEELAEALSRLRRRAASERRDESSA